MLLGARSAMSGGNQDAKNPHEFSITIDVGEDGCYFGFGPYGSISAADAVYETDWGDGSDPVQWSSWSGLDKYKMFAKGVYTISIRRVSGNGGVDNSRRGLYIRSGSLNLLKINSMTADGWSDYSFLTNMLSHKCTIHVGGSLIGPDAISLESFLAGEDISGTFDFKLANNIKNMKGSFRESSYSEIPDITHLNNLETLYACFMNCRNINAVNDKTSSCAMSLSCEKSTWPKLAEKDYFVQGCGDFVRDKFPTSWGGSLEQGN